MLKKMFLLGLGALLAVALAASLFPPATQAQQETSNPNFIFVNYIGQELFLDLDDVQYVVPGTATAPEGGRLELQLAPGEHKYAANVAGIGLGSAGEFTIQPGQVVAKAARLDQTSPRVENGILLEKPRDYVNVFDFNPSAPAAQETLVDTWQPAPAPAGSASIVWSNYNGVDELTIDLNGQLYTAPIQQNGVPGRLQINVDPGFYRYTVSVPDGAASGELNLSAGEITGLSVTSERAAPEYDEGEEFEFLTPATVKVFQEDLTAQATMTATPAMTTTSSATTTAVTPSTPLPVAGQEAAPAQAPVVQEGLLIKNFTGDTVIFTISGEAYEILANTERTLNLPPGQYNYTASLPFVARNGTLELAAGKGIELSIATNIAGDVLNVYQN